MSSAPRAEERRQEPRFPATGPCYLVLFDGLHDACARGSIVDVSKTGVRVRSRIDALPGMHIEVFLHDRVIVSGTVRHCSMNADGSYDLGVHIEEQLRDDVFAGLLKI